MSQKIKVLSFDLDDTLWPCSPTIQQAERLLYEWLVDNVAIITKQYDAQQLRDKRHLLLNETPQLACDLTQLRIKSFELLAEEFSLSDDWIEPAFKIFYEARQQVNLFDDVEAVLNKLAGNFQLVSLTNGNADPVKTKINHWFDFSLNSTLVGKLKCEPDIYQQVQKQLNINASEMLHIGDDPLQDVSGAKSAGVFAVWLNRQKKTWPLDNCLPDAEIESLYELPALIDRLNSGSQL